MAFRVDRRDIDFILKEVLDLNKILELDAYKDFSLEDFDMSITEGIRFAVEKVAPLNKTCDTVGATFKDGKVTMPPGMKEVYKEYCENGWNGIGASQEYGGMGMPGIASIPVGEALIGACVCFMMTPGLSRGAGHLVESFGTDAQKAMFVEKMYSGVWAGTMCLTEPQAGSAVGDVKTMATPVEGEENKYKIVGTKSFITSGEHDLTDQIIHLLLAKTPGAPAGFKGISLFVVPKRRVNPDGSLGELNDVSCGGIEHKMGIHGSPTCVLNFGENNNCEGYLVGELGKGLFHMFQMMNEARIGVGVQGLGQAAACFNEVLDYAKERIQGVDIADMKDVNAARVAIIKHPDIRRMLMTMKATTEGSRALLYLAAYNADIAMNSTDAKEREKAHDIIELLTPVCKAYCTDAAFRAADMGIQVLGGYGYCSEYPVEQYLRDVKISAIYEGTNGIQALDLLGRKLSMKGGMVFMNYLMKINNFLNQNAKDEVLGPLCKILGEARDKMAGIVGKFQAMGKKDMYYPILHATPFLELFSEVVIGHLLLEQAKIAKVKLQAILTEKGCDSEEKKQTILHDSSEAAFYHNKVQTASFYVSQIVPGVFGKAYSMETGDHSALEAVL